MIWIFSTDAFSGTGTSRLLGPVLELLIPWAEADELTVAHAVVRKMAHVAEYAVLGVLVLRALDEPGRAQGRIVLGTISLCAVYAMTDEYHQTYVASRVGAVSDVLLDTGGATLGTVAASWFRRPSSWGRRSRA